MFRTSVSGWMGAVLVCLGLALAVNQGQAGEKQSVTVKGSDTMVHLASQWAEAFMKKNAGIDLSVEISITGGGSGTGLAALLNGTTDVANSSRNIEEKEKKLAEQKKIEIKEHLVALDGICIVVNPECPLKDISTDQLAKIFTGSVTNWKDVGGPDLPIKVVVTKPGLAPGLFFQKVFMDGAPYVHGASEAQSPRDVITQVSRSPGGFGAAAEVHMSANPGDAKTVKAPKAVRTLGLVTVGEPTGAAKKVVDFLKKNK